MSCHTVVWAFIYILFASGFYFLLLLFVRNKSLNVLINMWFVTSLKAVRAELSHFIRDHSLTDVLCDKPQTK